MRLSLFEEDLRNASMYIRDVLKNPVAAERALIQILEKKYDTELIAEGNIIHYGIGFHGKDVVVTAEN